MREPAERFDSRRRAAGTGVGMRLIAVITERAVIVRILDHLGEPGRVPRMAPIRGPPDGEVMQPRDDLWTSSADHRGGPVVEVMPVDANHYQDLVW
jgi:hypothetical protein